MPYSFLHLDQVDSTNAFLLRQQQEGTAICGCVVSANEQTAGKGMGANQWESEPGMNLTFSMAVDMSFMKLPTSSCCHKQCRWGCSMCSNRCFLIVCVIPH